ncbi:UNVERIFIED_CONTAM: hypothetical protein FKN15_018811 [Acipenser sinensis]
MGNTEEGELAMGNTDRGELAMGNTEGAELAMGNTEGGELAMGNTDGGELATGNTEGGEQATGNTDGGELATGNTEGGELAMGNTDGGELAMGNTEGDELATGNAEGAELAPGNTEGAELAPCSTEGGLKAGGVGSSGAPGSTYHYTFHGDPHATFASFFGGSNPFDMFFGPGRSQGTTNGFDHVGGEQDMDLDMDGDEDPFSAFGRFGNGVNGFHHGGGGRRHPAEPLHRRGKLQDAPVVHELRVSLEEIFRGCTKRMKITRRRLNPDGRTARSEDKILHIVIKRGWKEGTKITFPKEGDETPENIPADIAFVLKDKPHPHFKRDGSNIIYSATICLKEVKTFLPQHYCTQLQNPIPGHTMSCTYRTLSTGQKMPLVGLGTWKSAPGEVKQAVLSALDSGYRHIDCAAAYGNEQEVGEALRERVGPGKPIKREHVFVTSKLWNTKHHPDDVEPACRKSLADLGLPFLDLYLMHWPMAFE